MKPVQFFSLNIGRFSGKFFYRRNIISMRAAAWCALPAIGAISFIVYSQSAPPAIPAISLSSDPLYAATSGDKPALALALSVEFPTVGAQYVDSLYSNTNEYLGYYDAEACYVYNNTPSETPQSGYTAADYKRFEHAPAAAGKATQRMCGDAFSGNFLNWASNSAIDMLRLALSGGDRYVDQTDLTILQRAVIPDGDPICMWNSSNFPAKKLARNGGGAGTYSGAVPAAMIAAAGANDIYVGNTLNRIYFGTSQGGGCGNTSSYNLNGPSFSMGTGPVTSPYSTPDRGMSNFTSAQFCGNEGNACTFSGTMEILYGANQGNTGGWISFPASNFSVCNNTMTGATLDPAPGISKKCYIRPYNGTWTPPSSGSALNSDGFFYARVKVCDQDSAGNLLDQRDYNFCTRYPNGKFKPTGTIQKYSDSLLLAAFGYAMDQTASYNPGGRYGGVLRAPIKYVGAKTFDIYGTESTPSSGNPVAEWSSTTGVFNANPDSDTTQSPGISGVINYLNKFGRTGPVPGRYKKYDPVGELHLETLRYLQGLPPSVDAVSNLTSAMYDGFPIYKDWTNLDPYAGRAATGNYACLKSNIVVIGDIHTHDGNRIPAANVANNIPDITAWTNVVRAFENNNAAAYVDGQGVSRTSGNPNTPNDISPTNQILGTAYWAHTHDIRGTDWTASPAKQRPGLRVKSFFFDVNEYGDETVDNHRRYQNQFFTAAKYGGFESTSSTGKPYNTYGNPFQNFDGTVNNDVWQDPARPGEAGSYFLQSNARSVLSAFDNIFLRASTAARSIAGAATRSGVLTQGSDNTYYQAAFDTSDWSGDVLALSSTVSSSNGVSIASTPTWNAAARLTALLNPARDRNIVVGNAGATTLPTATAFIWTAISPGLQGHLNKTSPGAVADNLGSDRLNFIRGDSSKEGTTFRMRRGKLLGDIINSGIVYSGTPSSSIFSAGYAVFRANYLTRAPAVFAGANDGMLHAFNASTGDELFAYIPNWMGPRLSALTSTAYAATHQSYVDATPTVAEALVGSVDSSTNWKTVLVGGTGAGGRGVYALDVTDPAAFGSSNVLWEFTSADDADMGNVVGRPQILKFRTSMPGSAATYKWFAVVASGVNNYVADSAGNASQTGQPALFLLDLAKQAGTAWALGTNYYKISLPIDSVLAATNPTGAINFKVTLGARQEVAKVYVGDLHGNMWKLDFTQRASTDWNMEKLTPFYRGTATNPIPYPLYIAKDAAKKIQPITSAPMLVRGESKDTIYVAFGTGKYLELADRTSTAQNSFYAIYDDGTNTSDGGTSPVQSAIKGRARLQPGSVAVGTGAVTVGAFTWGRAATDTDTTRRSGWYFDFPTSGERQISASTLSGSTLVFGSLIPGATASSSVCGASSGSGREYQANIDTGNATSRLSTVGLLGESMVLEITSAATSTPSDSTGRRVKTLTKQTFNQGSTGFMTGSLVTETQTAGRLSWRQIHNYQDLRTTP